MSKNELHKEKQTIEIMITMYCHDKHDSRNGLCNDCAQLMKYADARLKNCPFAEDKGPCSKCTVHCYKPEMRKKICKVMRYAGPRMLKKHPILAVKHLIKEKLSPPPQKT